MTLRLVFIVVLGSSAACDIGVSRPTATAWEGELIAVEAASPLTGTVAAVSQGNRTEAGISISEAEADNAYAWRIREGTCEAPEAVVGGIAAYHELEVDDSGQAADETVLSTTLRSEAEYHGVVMDAADIVLACGELIPS